MQLNERRGNQGPGVHLATHLDAVRVVVQQQDSQARHLLGLHHGLEVSQEVHVFGHISSQYLGPGEEGMTGGSIAPVPHSQTSHPLGPSALWASVSSSEKWWDITRLAANLAHKRD